MKEFLIGVVLSAVLLVAIFLVPSFLPSRQAAALTAEQNAELARRELHHYSGAVTWLGQEAARNQLGDADLEKLAAAAGAALEEQLKEINAQIQSAQRLDRGEPLPNSQFPRVSGDANGLRSALGGFNKLVADNDKLLAQAIAHAGDAKRAGGSVLGVSQIAGMTRMVKAYDHLTQARGSREQLAGATARALSIANEWAATRSLMDHFAGLDGAEIQQNLEADGKEIEALLNAANDELARLNGLAGERQSALTAARAALAQKRDELAATQDRGFALGNDSAYNAFRDAVRRLSDELRQLQHDEQMLSAGGLKGGTVADDGTEAGKLDGGEAFVGLETLKQHVTAAQDRVDRLTRGREAIQKQIEAVRKYDADAQSGEKALGAQLQKLQGEYDKAVAEIDQLANQSVAAEDAALAEAKKAVLEFDAAGAAAAGWMSALDAEKKEYDREGKNERLKKALADARTRYIPQMSKAEANALVGGILAERLAAESARKDAMERMTQIIKGSKFEFRERVDELISNARNEANQPLTDAKSAYEALARDDAKAAWVHQIALAAVALTLADVDTVNSARHLTDARDAIAKAARAENSPFYGREYRALNELLRGGSDSPAPSDSGSAEPKPGGDGAEEPAKP